MKIKLQATNWASFRRNADAAANHFYGELEVTVARSMRRFVRAALALVPRVTGRLAAAVSTTRIGRYIYEARAGTDYAVYTDFLRPEWRAAGGRWFWPQRRRENRYIRGRVRFLQRRMVRKVSRS